jgi:hypothetical protein
MKIVMFARCLALLLSLMALPTWAQDARGITAYQEIIDVAPGGSATVTLNVTLADSGLDRIDLPLNFAKPENFAVDAKDLKATAAAGKTGDVKVIKLQFDRKPAGEVKVQITFTAKEFFNWEKAKGAHGVYNLSYTFANATATDINGYALKVLLPTGYDIAGITSSTPKATGEEAEPPYDFRTESGRTALNLRSKSVAPGKGAAIAFGFEKDERNPLLVIALGIIIAALALYLKRDVLTDPDFVKETVA